MSTSQLQAEKEARDESWPLASREQKPNKKKLLNQKSPSENSSSLSEPKLIDYLLIQSLSRPPEPANQRRAGLESHWLPRTPAAYWMLKERHFISPLRSENVSTSTNERATDELGEPERTRYLCRHLLCNTVKVDLSLCGGRKGGYLASPRLSRATRRLELQPGLAFV